jgi:hypothetical protein
MVEPLTATPMDPDQRRHVRRTAVILGVLALAIYVGFILYSILRASH